MQEKPLGKRFDPDYKPPRDRFGILLSIETETDSVRPIFLFPTVDQDHICAMFGYCPIHQCVHEHPNRPKPGRRKKLGKVQGDQGP